jgi:hypothetical protein
MKIRIDFSTILTLQYLPASQNHELAIIIQKAFEDVYNLPSNFWHWNSTWIKITERQRNFLIDLIKSKIDDTADMERVAKSYHAIRQLNGFYK